MTAAVLLITAGDQIFDSNFVHLFEATALLAGDHPYRDFFEWGAPLPAYLSAGAQWVVGYRLIGEFLIHWLFIIAGVVISFDLAVRLSRSVAASLATVALGVVILAGTATYHYSKLFVFPLTVWLAWRYMERPGRVRSAALGAATAIAFLFRHDYGLYAGLASVLTLALTHLVILPGTVRSLMGSVAACTTAAAVLVMPWAIVVQLNEGLWQYGRARTALYEEPGGTIAYASLLRLNPLRDLLPAAPPAPKPAVPSFVWSAHVDARLQRQLEQEAGLRLVDGPDAHNRWHYEVANVYDRRLLALVPHITATDGFEWDRLAELRSPLPTRAGVSLWLQQMALLVPVLLLGSAALQVRRSRARATPVPEDAWRMVIAGVFLVVVDSALFREASYMTVVAPITAALSARLGVTRAVLARACAIAAFVLTSFAACVWAKDTALARPPQYVAAVANGVKHLVESPPAYDDHRFEYARVCTAPGDRVLVTGMTPFHVSYFAQRPIAGGHLYWRSGWRSDPVHEAQSLALLQSQSVPLAISTRDRILDDFERYPKIRAYLAKHYVEVEGSNGLMMVDARRQVTDRYGPSGYPCFR